MILKKFFHVTGMIEIHLNNDRKKSRLVMHMRYESVGNVDGGCVDGFTYAVDNVWGIKAKDAAKLEVIKHMAITLQYNLHSGAWHNFTKASGKISDKNES